MQVPEKLSLIGGSILLASTLIFTLKSQASSIVPKVGDSIGSVYQDITNTDAEHGGMSFDDAFKNAQKQHWQTGQWGSSKWYIDKDMNMHIGAGELNGKLYDIVGDKNANSIKTITLDGNIKAPANSIDLFAGGNYHAGSEGYKNTSITAINGLDKLDTSQVTDMTDMFYHDNALSNDLAVSNWDTSNVVFLAGTFGQTNISQLNVKDWNVKKLQNTSYFVAGDAKLSSLDLSGWHTNGNLNYAGSMFSTGTGIHSLDLSNFDTTNIIPSNIPAIFGGSNDSWDTPLPLSKLTLGSKTLLKNTKGLSGTWRNGDQTLSGSDLMSSGLNNQPAHPGTWIKQ